MANWKDTVSALQTKWDTDIATPYSVQTQYNNDGTFELDDESLGTYSCWARVFTLMGEDIQIDISPNPSFRTAGIFRIQLFTPLEYGEANLLTLADLIRLAFLATTVGDITYRTPSIGNPRREDNWWRVDISCPFRTDRTKT